MCDMFPPKMWYMKSDKWNVTSDMWYALWFWGKALALRVSSFSFSFRDAEPHPVIVSNAKKNHGLFQKQLRTDINTSLFTTDFCLHSTVWQWRFICYYRICQLGFRNRTEYALLCIFLCLDVWLCIKIISGNMVIMRLLQIEAKDLTVYGTHDTWWYGVVWCGMVWWSLWDN